MITDRFASVKFDEKRTAMASRLRFHCGEIALELEAMGRGRSISMALTKLEECHMWCGKAIRDDQLKDISTDYHEPAP